VSTPSRVRVEMLPDGRQDLRVCTPGGAWIRLHSANDPEREARGLLERTLGDATVPPVVAVIGVGQGFVIDELLARRPDVRIVALEVLPDLVEHWQARTACGGLIASGQVVVGVAPAYELPKAAWPAAAIASDPPIVVHPAIAHHWPDKVELARKALQQFLFERRANEEARQRLAPMYFDHVLRNLPTIASAPDVSALEGIAAGERVILCGAGPSLDRLLPALRQLRERAWLVALDTAVRPLISAGVVPDLVVSIDPTPLNGRHLLDITSRQRPWVVAEPSLYPPALRAFEGRVFVCRVNRSDPWPWLEEAGLAPTKVRAWGSVLTTACDLVVHMRPSAVAFAAVDLAYTDGQTYCRGTAFEQDWEEQRCAEGLPTVEAVWEARLRGHTVDEADVHGRATRTASHLVAFRNWVRGLVTETTGMTFANVTNAGILHGDRIVQTSLDAWLDGVRPLATRPEERLVRAAHRATCDRRDALCRATGDALASAEQPWTGWTERVPGVDRSHVQRVLEHNRRRLVARRGEDSMSATASEWIDVPFDAALFTATAPMEWQVREEGGVTYTYRLDGKTLFLSFKINHSTLAGSPARQLFLRLPGEFRVARGTANGVWIGSQSIKEMGYATVHPGHDFVVIHRGNEEPFPLEPGYFFLFGQLMLEVQ